MHQSLRVLLIVVLLAAFVAAPVAAYPGPTTDQPKNGATIDRSQALVQLKGEPLSTYSKTKPVQGKKIDFNKTTVKSYRAQLSALRNSFKKWLRANAPKARVTSEFDVSLNAIGVALNGESLAKIAAAPMVAKVQYEGLYTPSQDVAIDPDLALINAPAAWDQIGGSEFAGVGVKVAVIDTGIDITHPCFADDTYEPADQLGDTRFTNNKVIVAKVFNMKTTSRGYTPEAIGEHGTHVAGTIACNYNTPAVVDGVSIPHGISGVAPRALLGSYNVFPADVANARSEDILNALEAAYADGFDVANMSLGGGAHGVQDLLTIAVDNLDKANMVVAVAAGNSGPGFDTVESPGSAQRALTAGASTVPHFVGAPVTVGETSYGAAAGDFATVEGDFSAPLAVVPGATNGLDTACAALPEGSLSGAVALVSRGTCAFSVKVRNAQNAGAAAVLVANNVAGDPTAMATDGMPNQPTVPAYMVAKDTVATFIAANGASVTISAANSYFVSTNADIMAGFSSQGPTDVDFRVKPDVVAPGVNVLSAIPAAYCGEPPCFAFFSGTSMATPHLAGMAAVLKGQHGLDWNAAAIRSAIVNTADEGVLKDYQNAEPVADPNVAGAGRANLSKALNAVIGFDPVSVSFTTVPSRSGQTLSYTVTAMNLSSFKGEYTLAITPGLGDDSVAYSLSTDTIRLAFLSKTTFTINMTAMKGATRGSHSAWLRVYDGQGNEVAHAALYTFIK